VRRGRTTTRRGGIPLKGKSEVSWSRKNLKTRKANRGGDEKNYGLAARLGEQGKVQETRKTALVPLRGRYTMV